MKMHRSLQEQFTPTAVFLWGLVILVAITLVMMPFTGGESGFSLLHSNLDDSFMDFFNSIYDAGFENPYTERGVIYPPLTYLYYRLCGLMLPEVERNPDSWYARKCALNWKSGQYGLFLVLATTVLSYILLIKALLPPEKRNDPAARRLTYWIVLGTVPFWYAVERGNLILLTLAFLAYFVTNYRSESKLRRELALVSLAMAASFKIYPVVFGLLLLLDKQFFAALRCVLYGAVLMFLPFLFVGGMSSVRVMVDNIMNTSDAMTNYGLGYKVNLDNTLSFMAECLHVPVRGASKIKLLFLAVIAAVFIFTRKPWQRYMALSAVMIIFPGFSYTYTLIFAAIPLMAFLLEKPGVTTRNLLFAFLFLGMFAPFPFGGYMLFKAEPVNLYQLNLTTIISSFSILALLLMMAMDTVFCRIRRENATAEMTVAQVRGSVIRFVAIVLILIALLTAFCMYSNHLYELDIMPL